MRTIISLVLLTVAISLSGCERPIWETRAVAPPPPEIESSTAPLPPAHTPVAMQEDGGDVRFDSPGTPRAAQPVDTFRTHVIQRNDTLWSIARQYYGDGAKWRMIAEYNNISNPNKLPIGRKITLP